MDFLHVLCIFRPPSSEGQLLLAGSVIGEAFYSHKGPCTIFRNFSTVIHLLELRRYLSLKFLLFS